MVFGSDATTTNRVADMGCLSIGDCTNMESETGDSINEHGIPRRRLAHVTTTAATVAEKRRRHFSTDFIFFFKQ